MKIAILGGSFNPPHVAHVLAATWVLSTRPVDEVWFMPVGEHAFGKKLVAFEDRRRMVELAIEPISGRCRITDVENRLEGPNRTIDSLQQLQKEHPEAHFSLIIGADILTERHAWKSWDVLERDHGFHLLGRASYKIPVGYGAEVELPNVSSTTLRALLGSADVEACRGMIPQAVLDHIVARGLYGFGAAP